jgi:hypothetical protein
MLNLPVPKANYHNIVLKPSEQQKEMVASLSERAERVRNKMVDSSVDNMLLITNDGRKLALGSAAHERYAPDSETGKWAPVLRMSLKYGSARRRRAPPRWYSATCLRPMATASFNVYDDLRDKLIAKGVPAEEIAYIHTADSEAKRKSCSARCAPVRCVC